MLCQDCLKKQASFHYTFNHNGSITEKHLCHECAKKQGLLDDSNKILGSFAGLNSGFESSEGMLGELLEGLFDYQSRPHIKQASICPFCKMNLSEFMHKGKAGCAKCYTTFKDAISPTLQKLHGNTKHAGKIPAERVRAKSREEKIKELELLLNEAVATQEYEKAAEYRDKIKALNSEEIQKGGEL